MSKSIYKVLLLGVLITNSYAHIYSQENEKEENKFQRDRVHSTREALDNFSIELDKNLIDTQNIQNIFTNAKISGQFKNIYAGYSYTNKIDQYAIAVGGILKCESGVFNGINTALGVYFSQDISFASAKESARNTELSSAKAYYIKLGEAYINYDLEALNIRIGRQVLETPLADSDEIRMNKNSFEAYTLSYKFNKLEFMCGNIQRWQGFDAGLDKEWHNTAQNGVNFLGLNYENSLELHTWLYNFTGEHNTGYIDLGYLYNLNENYAIHTVIQYLQQQELQNSGIQSSIYGGLFELFLYDLNIKIAYNKSLTAEGKRSFSGLGGGALFTSLDTMVLDTITKDSDTQAITFGFMYEIKSFSILYTNGNFKSQLEHIQEQNLGGEYHLNESFSASFIIVKQEDLLHSFQSGYDWDRLQLTLHYYF